jgi:predicted transcriptional regulator
MFDEETQDALSRLSEEELTKVSFMIKKLAKKKQSARTKRSDTQDFSVQKKNQNRRTAVVAEGERVNLFLDMPEFNDHKEDVEIDKMLSKMPPTPRNRKTNLVEVMCMACNKPQTVAAALIPVDKSRYLCNNCQVRGARN